MAIYERLRVFVSSKMEELGPERQAIKTALNNLKVDGWMFEEDAGARPQTIRQTFLEEVKAADLYVGVFWKGYGDYTIEEYEHSCKLGKDCLIYEKRPDLEGRDPRLQSFLDRVGQVETGLTIQRFETPEELAEIIQQDVQRWQVRKVRERYKPQINVNLSLAESRERDQLLILLHYVKQFWIENVLEQSVHSEALIALGKEWAEAEEHPWEQILELPDQTRRPLPSGRVIVEVFGEVGRSLLILGAPGSGKTITLLELTRDLIQRADPDPSQPIPVVFNLSSWAEKRQPLLAWLTEELGTKYRVPKRIGRSWLEENWLLPMLDGLDEVPTEHRAACVEAISSFIDETGVPGMAVCSRIEEYTALPKRLKTGGAICLQPLSWEQVETYVERSGPALASLRMGLQQDQVLRTLAETPLMLSIMSLAYQNRTVDSSESAARQSSSLEERRDQIFGLYVERMFQRKRSDDLLFPKDKVIGWLSWLAKEMKQHSQSVFMVEGLEPSWLATMNQWISYRALVALPILLSVALLLGLVVGLSVGLREGLKEGLGAGLSLGLLLGLLVGVLGIGPLNRISLVEVMGWSWKPFWKNVLGGLIFGPIFGLIAVLWGGLMFALREGRIGGLSEALSDMLMPVLALGLILGLTIGLIRGLNNALTDKIKGEKGLPNEGIKLSAKNGTIAAAIGCVIFGSIFGLSVGLIFGLSVGLSVGLTFGLIFGLVLGLNRGGSAAVQHYSLRLTLWLCRYTPIRFIKFLDYCPTLILLKKVGGGYIFIHRMLLEYFARAESSDGPPARTLVS
jgi:hypothetical protein